jgi:predicted nucleic acid-binding protein
MPDPATVSNSSCLIGLDLVGQLDLLHGLYGTILVPSAVSCECGSRLPQWIQVQPIQNHGMARTLQLGLGAGESEAVVLASETSAARLILDDKKARRVAQQLGLPITGTLAVLLRAKQQGLIPNLRDVLDDLAAVHFRISDALVQDALPRAGE